MIVSVNGKKREFPENLTVENLVEILKLDKDLIAIEINGDIIRKANYKEHILKEGDEIEILTLIGGG
ncbi:MAG: sulfur carrier protein ThiS [Planctomycetota bacterium]